MIVHKNKKMIYLNMNNMNNMNNIIIIYFLIKI